MTGSGGMFEWLARSEERVQWIKHTLCQRVDQHPTNARLTWSPPLVVPPLQRQGWDLQGKLAS